MGIRLALIFVALLAAYLIAAGAAAFVSPDLDWKPPRIANPWHDLPEGRPEGGEGRRIAGGVLALLTALGMFWLIFVCVVCVGVLLGWR